MMEWSWLAFGLGAVVMFALLQVIAELAKKVDPKYALRIKQSPGVEIDRFKKEFPVVEGYTLGNLRVDGGKVLGFVLLDKEGNERYILYLGADCKVESYW